MADTYVALSSLKHYDEKIKEVIDEKQDQLVGTEGQVVSFDVDGNVIAKDLENVDIDTSNFVEKEEGKGLFSGSYNDLADKPDIPSVDGLVSEDTLSETLEDYAKTDDLPSEYDDTALSNRVAANEEAIAKLNGSGEGSVTKSVDDALNEFATNISNDGVVNTYKELVDYAAEHSSDIAEIVSDIETNTTSIEELENRVDIVETNLGGHTVKSDVPENAKFTDTTNFLPLAGGTMNKNSSITIPSANLAGGVILKDDTGYTATLTSDCLHIEDNEGNTSVIGGSSVYSSSFVGDLTGKVNGYTINKDVPSDAKFTDTTYSNFVKSGSGAKAGLVPAPSTTAGTTKYLREDGTWQVPPDTNTTYSVVTQSAQGLMSASDKTKLDGIATGANKTIVDSTLSSTSTNPVQNKVINTALAGKASTSVATTSANGLMSSTDKSKLDGIASGATKVTVDSALSSTSTNPVQNKVINTALASKAASSHTHNYLPLNGGIMNTDANIAFEDSTGIASGITINSTNGTYTTSLTSAEFRGNFLYGQTYRIEDHTTFGMKYGTGMTSGDEGLLIGDLSGDNEEYTIFNNDAIAESSLRVYGNLTDGKNNVPYIQTGIYDSDAIGRGSGLNSSTLYNDNLNYWWVKFSTGMMIVGFNHALQGNTNYHYIYLPVSFVNNKYAVIMTDNGEGASTNGVRMQIQYPSYFQLNTQLMHYQSTDYAESTDVLSGVCIGRWK